MPSLDFRAILRPDHERYEGVRPIQIYLMRLGFLLVIISVGGISVSNLLAHEGDWDPVRAAALSMWAAFAVLSVLGLINPLRWIPLFLLEIGYKTIWLAVVAYPLWAANRLADSPAEDMALSFLPVIFPIVAMPWPYVFKTFVRPLRPVLR